MAKLRELVLPKPLKEALTQGHPWVYRDRLNPQLTFAPGEWLRLKCGNWTGYGLWDQDSPIALRIFSHRYLPDRPWFRARIQTAWELRESLRQNRCTAYRWLFGEGDGLPGVTVDLYGEFAVIQTYMASAEILLKELLAILPEITPLQGILLRSQHHGEIGIESEGKTQLLWGEWPPTDYRVQEHGLTFQVNLTSGQKTGLFLDHRENRRFLGDLAQGKTLLNCFSYTGAFSLYGLRGGATQVTNVDIGKGLAGAAVENVRLNGFETDRHRFVTADCFDFLEGAKSRGETYDILILDPPSFAKTKQNRFAALRAYTKINALALGCVAPGGLLVSASCTSQIGPELFKEMLAQAAIQGDRRLQIIHEAGQPFDHPIPVAFPEGRYLKFVVCRVGDRV